MIRGKRTEIGSPLHCRASQKMLREWRKRLKNTHPGLLWVQICERGFAAARPTGLHRDRGQG